MDLTDKIKLSLLVGIKTILETKIFGFAGNRDEAYFIDGAKMTLDYITPKVAIDFARWLACSNYMVLNRKYIICSSYINLGKIEHISEEQLFQEFLKDYKYED